MVEQIDFGELYERIGVTPACSLGEFQLAYRRRVAALHPDRNHGNFVQLQRLNTLYTAAMTFHRQSGRLPGARPVTDPRHPATPARPNRMTVSSEPGRSPRRRHPWLLAFMLLALLSWALEHQQPDPTPPPAIPSGASGTRPDSSLGSPSHVQLGMLRAMVIAIEGEPLHETDTHWDYGPSWIEFRCGVVDGWYSSPLRSLHVRSPRPETDSGRAAPDCSEPGIKVRQP